MVGDVVPMSPLMGEGKGARSLWAKIPFMEVKEKRTKEAFGDEVIVILDLGFLICEGGTRALVVFGFALSRNAKLPTV